jgi:hypothetical protein
MKIVYCIYKFIFAAEKAPGYDVLEKAYTSIVITPLTNIDKGERIETNYN